MLGMVVEEKKTFMPIISDKMTNEMVENWELAHEFLKKKLIRMRAMWMKKIETTVTTNLWVIKHVRNLDSPKRWRVASQHEYVTTVN